MSFMPRSFIADETGAITVDYVVLTAGLVGLALAATAMVLQATGTQSGAIDGYLRNITIGSTFERIFASEDFSEGRGDWVGGELRNVDGFGDILSLSGTSPTAELPINIGTNHDYAVVEFDMIIADSWDDEQGSVSINGSDVLIGRHAWRNDAPVVQTFEGAEDTTVTLTRTSTGTGGTWRRGVNDYTYKVRVTAKNDGSDIRLGAATTLNQNGRDEFFGIDNVKVSGTNKP